MRSGRAVARIISPQGRQALAAHSESRTGPRRPIASPPVACGVLCGSVRDCLDEIRLSYSVSVAGVSSLIVLAFGASASSSGV